MFVASRVALRPASTLPGLLTLAALKPHLGCIYWLGFFADLIRRRAWGICVATGGFMLLLTALVETLTPGAIVAWWNGAGGALTWMGASPVTYVRMVFRMPNSSPPLWPVLFGAMFAIGLAIWHLVRQGRWFDREKDLALFTTLSLCATPYLWCLDFSVLLLAELSVLAPGGADATSHIRPRLAAGIVMMARIAIALQMVLGVVDYRTGWYPLAILLALILAGSSAESRTLGNARGRMAVARNCKALPGFSRRNRVFDRVSGSEQ